MTWALNAIGTVPKNCWLFVRDVYKEQLGVELPQFASIMMGDIPNIVRTMEIESKNKMWKKVEDPSEFAVVAMSKSQYIHHVGLWTEEDGGKVLHSYEKNPVVANDILQLRRVGFKRVEFYELDEAYRNIEPV